MSDLVAHIDGSCLVEMWMLTWPFASMSSISFAGLLFGISTRTQPAKQLDFVRLIHRLSFGFSLKNLVAFRDCEYLSGHAATSSAESKVTSSSGVGCSELSASTSLSA